MVQVSVLARLEVTRSTLRFQYRQVADTEVSIISGAV
jgi:hypothetical protein